MFRFFHKNKMQGNKGQMMPVFILVLVILLIMAMVTVNLGKISLMKTDTSNAADAGALAGGSTMANYFNQQAYANQFLIQKYETFRKGTAVAAAAAVVVAALAAAAACAGNPCPHPISCCPSGGCLGGVKGTITALWGAMAVLIMAHLTQFISYKSMRKHSYDGRAGAMKLAYRFAFYNSGIGNKLISGKVPATGARGNAFNYSARFNEFIDQKTGQDASKPPDHLDYAWTDGQSRGHLVRVKAITDDVKDYQLHYAFVPTVIIIMVVIRPAIAVMTGAMGACSMCPCTASAMFGFAGAMAVAMTAYIISIQPMWSLPESGLANVAWIICWIDDIIHDRLFRVATWQVHEGETYGLWETQYPKRWNPATESAEYIEGHSEKRISSFGEVDFEGNGTIYPPVSNFDADLVKTDYEGD